VIFGTYVSIIHYNQIKTNYVLYWTNKFLKKTWKKVILSYGWDFQEIWFHSLMPSSILTKNWIILSRLTTMYRLIYTYICIFINTRYVEYKHLIQKFLHPMSSSHVNYIFVSFLSSFSFMKCREFMVFKQLGSTAMFFMKVKYT